MPLAALAHSFSGGMVRFNGGSVLKLDDVVNANSVAMVFVNQCGAAGGVIVALLVARVLFGRRILTMALSMVRWPGWLQLPRNHPRRHRWSPR